MAGVRITRSGFAEGTGLGYALEKVGDPGRGRKDPVSRSLAQASLVSISGEIERISAWAATKDLDIEYIVGEARDSIIECRAVLQTFRTQKKAKEAADRVSAAYKSLWASIARY